MKIARADVFTRCAVLAAVLILASCSPKDAATDDKKAAEVIAFLQENPNFLNEHPELLEAAERAAIMEQNARNRDAVEAILADFAALFQDPLIPAVGAKSGDVVIYEFSDYICGPCRASFPHLDKVWRDDKNVRVAFLPFPLFGNNAELAARAAFGAMLQGRFYDFHHAVMTAPGYIDRTYLLDIAEAVGLDLERLKADMNDPRYERLKADVARLAQRLGVEGPPAFLVGNSLLTGGVIQSDLESAIAFERCLSKNGPSPSACLKAERG